MKYNILSHQRQYRSFIASLEKSKPSTLESRDRFVFFVRPRRFGKSLFISMMQCYYDRREKENFEKYFGGLWLGANPTANRNKYMVLMLDFSQAGAVEGKTLQECFDIYLETCLDSFMRHYPACYDAAVTSSVAGRGVLAKFMAVVKVAHEREIPL